MDSILKNFTDSDISAIQSYIDSEFIGPMPAHKIHGIVQPKLSRQFTTAVFSSAFSAHVKEGNLKGIQGKRKIGYFKVGSELPKPVVKAKTEIQPKLQPIAKASIDQDEQEETKAATKPAPVVIPAPKYSAEQVESLKYARFIWIGNKTYRVHKTTELIRKLARACGGAPGDGDIVIAGKRWACSNTDIFQSVLVDVFYAAYAGESEPVFDDGSGRTIEMRIATGETHIEKEFGLY